MRFEFFSLMSVPLGMIRSLRCQSSGESLSNGFSTGSSAQHSSLSLPPSRSSLLPLLLPLLPQGSCSSLPACPLLNQRARSCQKPADTEYSMEVCGEGGSSRNKCPRALLCTLL